MAIVGNAPQSMGTPWGDVLGPIGQILSQNLAQHRQQQQQMQQSKVIEQIFSQLPQDANAMDMIRALMQSQSQGVSQENVKPYLEAIPKFQEVQRKGEAENQKKQASLQPYQSALDILKRQRELLKGENLGPKVAFIGTGRKAGSTFTPQGIKDRAEYERLGKALISQSSNIKISNRPEFETLAHDLYDPLKTHEEIAGILDAMERIIKGSMQEQGIVAPEGADILGRIQSSPSRKVRQKSTGKIRELPSDVFKEYVNHPDFEFADEQNQ